MQTLWKVTKPNKGQDMFSKMVQEARKTTSHPYWVGKENITSESLKETMLEQFLAELNQAIRYAVLHNEPYIRVEINRSVIPECFHDSYVTNYFGIPATILPDAENCKVYVGIN